MNKKRKTFPRRNIKTIEKTDGSKIQIADCSILFEPSSGEQMLSKTRKASLEKRTKDRLLAKHVHIYVPTEKATRLLMNIHQK